MGKQIGGNDFTLINGIADTFEPRQLTTVLKPGAVTGSKDRRIIGAAVFINQNTLITGQSGSFGKLGIGDDANTDNDEIRGLFAPIAEPGTADTCDPPPFRWW